MGQIFVVGVSGMLTLKNLEITGGACNEGSAVLVSGNVNGGGGKLLALNVLFHNNTATGGGGAVMVKAGAMAHIRSCVFDDNTVSYLSTSSSNCSMPGSQLPLLSHHHFDHFCNLPLTWNFHSKSKFMTSVIDHWHGIYRFKL